MSTVPTTFSPTPDMSPLLIDLTTQASAVLASIHALQIAHAVYTSTSDAVIRRDCAAVLQERGVAMETHLGGITLNARLINEERLEAWGRAADSAAEMQNRRQRLQMLCEKMEDLGKAMAGLRCALDGDDVDSGEEV